MGYLVSHNLYRCKIDRLGNDNGPEIWAFQKPYKINGFSVHWHFSIKVRKKYIGYEIRWDTSTNN